MKHYFFQDYDFSFCRDCCSETKSFELSHLKCSATHKRAINSCIPCSAMYSFLRVVNGIAVGMTPTSMI